MYKKTIYLFLVIILGTVSDVFSYNFVEHEGGLEASRYFSHLPHERDKVVKRRKNIVNYIRDVYDEFAVENELSYQCDERNPSLQTLRGHFDNEVNIIFNTKNIERPSVHRLEFAVLITNRLNRLFTSEYSDLDIIIHIHNTEYISVERCFGRLTWSFVIKIKKEIVQKAVRLAAKSGKSYLVFDISSSLVWNQPSISISNYVTVNESKIRISKTNQPIVVTFNGGTRNPLLTPCANRVTRDTYDDLSEFITRSGRSNGATSLACQKRDWTMDMSFFSFTWYIRPRYVKADICSGNCETPLTLGTTNSTNYSYVKNLWHVQTWFLHSDIPRACCVPVAYLPLWVLVFDESGEPEVKSIPNMRVKYCGCR